MPVPVTDRPAADLMTDVVIVGSTPGALCAAIACRQAGLEVLVAEPSGQLGGIAATRGGRLWLPGRRNDACEITQIFGHKGAMKEANCLTGR